MPVPVLERESLLLLSSILKAASWLKIASLLPSKMLTVLRKGNTWSVFPMCSYFCAKFGYCAPRICKAGPGRWPRQPCRFGFFFFPVVLSKADLHQHFLCLLKLKPRQLNTGDLSFICCLIAGSQGLAWALILTFMSQVSLAQEL